MGVLCFAQNYCGDVNDFSLDSKNKIVALV